MFDMFKRSEHKHNLRYKYLIGDGDAAHFKAISTANLYTGFEVKKKECISHVRKRLGKRSRDLKKNWGTKKLSDG